MNTIYSMLTLTLIFSTPIIITAVGGMFSERSGIVNIALEGIMMVGGFTAATAIVFLERAGMASDMTTWISLIFGVLGGMLISLIHAYLCVNLNADQVISGTAINLLAGGITIYLSQIIFHQQRTETFEQGFLKTTYAGLSDIPVIGDIFFTTIYPTVYVAFLIVILSWFLLYKTPFGLRLRATGEHPQAVDSMGINVYKMRYIGVIISGALGGLGGAIMILTFDTQYTGASIHGVGFISLAALIFGKWKPSGVVLASLFFGFSQILGVFATTIDFLAKVPNEYFSAIPYIMTIIALVIFSGKAVGPKAAGQPYDKGLR